MKKIAIIILALLALMGCELFKVREAEPPTKPPLWNNFVTTWSACLQNLEYCYSDARNVVKYSSLFTPGYRFHFAAQDLNDYGINMIWGREQEQDMLFSLHDQCDSLSLRLTEIPNQADLINPSDATIYRSYVLKAYKKDQSAAEAYEGNLEIRFKKDLGNWYIDLWNDYRSSSLPTWGKLKYDHSQ